MKGELQKPFFKNGFQTVWQDTVLYRSTLLFGRVLLFYPFEKKKGIKKIMKRIINSFSVAVLTLALLFSFASCGNTNSVDKKGLWENATYLEDTELGKGDKTVVLEVKVEDQSVTFTVNTDKKTVGDALVENDLIAGDESEYGLYVKKVNGMTADYDKDKSYWAFYIDGNYATTGVDQTDITDGAKYKLEYTK